MDFDFEAIDDGNSSGSSPFKAMSVTTDKLSLRQSHIGPHFPDSRLMVSEYQKCLRSSKTPKCQPLQEFVPYPPDIISTTVERSSSSDWGYQSKSALISHRITEKNRSDKTENKQRIKRISSSESMIINNGHNGQECNGFDEQSVASLQSNISSDTNITAIECSNASNQTEEVVKINEYIQVSISDDTTGPLFDLKRKLALERGRAEQLNQILEDMVRERSELQMKLHFIEKDVKLKTEKIVEMNHQRESLISDAEELKSGIRKWETIVSEYQQVVDAKSNEVEALSEDIVKLNETNQKLKIDLEHLKIDMDSKDNAINELNKKISLMNADINGLIQSKVSLEEEVKRKKAEIEDTVNQKELSELEVNKVRVHLNETHQKLVTEQQISIAARNESERVQTLNSLLKQELIEMKHKTVKEKENLMKHLEIIGAQMVLNQSESQSVSHKTEECPSTVKPEDLSSELRLELSQKESKIERLSQELSKTVENHNRLFKENSLLSNEIDSLKRQNSEKDLEVQTSKAYSSDLELKIRGLNIGLKRQKEMNEILRKDNKESESKLNALLIENKSLESITKQMKETIERHERSLKQMQSNVIAKEAKLELAEKEKNKILDAVHSRDQELDQLRRSTSSAERDPNELSFIEMKIRNEELEKVMNNINTELRANQMRFDEQKNQLVKECSQLKMNLTEERLRSEIATKNAKKLIEELSEKLKTSDKKIIDLQMELNSIKLSINNNNIDNNNEIIDIKNEKIRSLESNVKLLTKKYRQMIETKKELEEKLQSIEQKSGNTPKILVSTQTEEFGESVNHLEILNRNLELMEKIESLKEEIQSKDSMIEENQKTILNLEHQRGKLWTDEHESTNKHIQSLELIIASKRQEVLELTENLSQKNQNLKEIEIQLHKKISETENELKKERTLIKDLRHSVFTEKRENSYLKRDLNELKKALSESNAIADKRKQQVIDANIENQTIRAIESSLRTEIDRINSELKAVKEENEKLKNKFENTNRKSEPLLEQLKNLSLNLIEKNQEIEGLKSQFSSVRERYESEVQALRQRICDYESDGQHLNNELSELKKTKFSLQSRLTELRLHLKNSYEQNQKLRQQLNSYEAVVAQESTFNEELVTKLLDQSADNTKEIK